MSVLLADADGVYLGDEEFLLLRDLICEHCGILVPDSMRFLLERRLRPRLVASGARSFLEYYRALKYGRDRLHEMGELIDVVTTNETYFFRERHQLQAFTEEIVPAVVAERGAGATVRIWSAGCSSGEEPYTIAMLLDTLPAARGTAFEIFGSDISSKVLRMARAGVYRDSALRDTDAQWRSRYFVPAERAHALREDIRGRVSFGHLNLVDEAAMALVANVDVIFCRNVMIYFSKQSRAALLDAFYRKLRAGGYLLLGHSESLVNAATRFEIVALKTDIVYRRPLAGVGMLQ